MSRLRLLELGMVAMAILMPACSQSLPETRTITIVNETDYDMEVHVSDAIGEAWLPLAVIGAHSDRSVEQVNDQGDVWMFRFFHWGDSIAELSINRDELQRNDWRIEVPLVVEQRLEQLGRPVSE